MYPAIQALIDYRGFIFGSVKREFESKYRNSLLGAAWTVINPLAMIFVYTVIFSQVMRSKLPHNESTYAYSIYLCAGVLTWGLFAEVTGRAQNVFLEHANLLKKLSFPRLCLPVIVILSALVNFLIIFGLFTVFLIFSGNFPGIVFLALAPLLFLQIAFSIGLGVTLGVLNVFFRDVGQLYSVLILFWFWMTPIVYPVSILPEMAQSLLTYNPMAGIITGYQTVLVKASWPDWSLLWLPAVSAMTLCFIGLRLFRKHSGEIVDEL
jgi:lipopolysaccharide transport system permease protein